MTHADTAFARRRQAVVRPQWCARGIDATRLRRKAASGGLHGHTTTHRHPSRWIIAFDGRGHRLLRDGVVVLEATASSTWARASTGR